MADPFPDYREWARLNTELGRARYRCKFLDYPLFVREKDEPRVERKATDEEVATWKASADAEITRLEGLMAALVNARAEATAQLERSLAASNEIVGWCLDYQDGGGCVLCARRIVGGEHDEDCLLVTQGFVDRQGRRI